MFPLSGSTIQKEDQSKKSTFEAFVIKSPDPDAHGPLSFSAPGEEEKIDLVSEVSDLTDKLAPMPKIQQAFNNHPSYSNFVYIFDDDVFNSELQKAIDMGIINPQGA